MGWGLPNLSQYYNRGEGSTGTPNLYYIINGRPLNWVPFGQRSPQSRQPPPWEGTLYSSLPKASTDSEARTSIAEIQQYY